MLSCRGCLLFLCFFCVTEDSAETASWIFICSFQHTLWLTTVCQPLHLALQLAGRVDLARLLWSRCLARNSICVWRQRTICVGCWTRETDPRLLATSDGQGDCGPPHGVASSRAQGLGTFSESFLDCKSHVTWTCWKSCSRTNMNKKSPVETHLSQQGCVLWPNTS